ncbi:MAG: 2-oxoglutarate dehydrogenase E1 component, partial [Calditrichia bacterium]|nr:2-oxoglutarate dehydrogenase E1 component [Calditrichia bacterium]
MKDISYLSNAHPQFIESLYKQFLEDPDSVDKSWHHFFQGFEWALNNGPAQEKQAPNDFMQNEIKVLNLINGYRRRGHLFTKTNPVRSRRNYQPTLDIKNFGLTEEDMDKVFQAGIEIGIGPATLKKIIEHLQLTYCSSIGTEFEYIRQPERVKWLRNKLETSKNIPNFPFEEKKRILDKLTRAIIFENFLHNRYVGQKRFSLSGGETLIPGLDSLIQYGSSLGIETFMIGISHRGRLNVLANILQKKYEEIFIEFEGAFFEDSIFAGDAKYHLGYTSKTKSADNRNINIGLAPNPSHLEAVGGVIQGMSRAKIDKYYNGDNNKVLPIIIHGDAAIAAQGVVYEVLQMSELEAYQTGGSIHLVINNQVGFTTNYLQGRSSTYCTDIAKVTRSPVFHVNADDVEAVVLAIKMAVEYRQTFHTDVFIDLLGYRKYGHNEGDEPRFTQPKLYKTIAKHEDPRKIYLNSLLKNNDITRDEAKQIEQNYKIKMQETFEIMKNHKWQWQTCSDVDDCDRLRRTFDLDFETSPSTKFDNLTFKEIGEKVFTIPKNKNTFQKIKKLYETRKHNLLEKQKLDWAMGETMAYATLLHEGVNIRISGQDTERGTFSHRHAVLLDEQTEELFVPLQNISEKQGTFNIYNSLLSEYGVLGFEYGYSCASPTSLTIWEAQFGDFANNAQVVIDQFISAGEQKWNQLSGLVMLLPHGYEGQGPEHSSARLERYLQLCAERNLKICMPTTPAQIFHLLRQQMMLNCRKPLIVMSPKSLLRHRLAVSTLEDLSEGEFKPLIPETDNTDKKNITRVIMCSGKVYYDLYEKQVSENRTDIAIIRVEQLYPFPKQLLRNELKQYKNATEFLWCQEEPKNQG